MSIQNQHGLPDGFKHLMKAAAAQSIKQEQKPVETEVLYNDDGTVREYGFFNGLQDPCRQYRLDHPPMKARDLVHDKGGASHSYVNN